MYVLADVGDGGDGLWILFTFLAPFALGWGLGLLSAIIVLARKPRVPVGGCLLTGVAQLLTVCTSFFVVRGIFISYSNTNANLFFLLGPPGSFILGTLAMLGPALFVRRYDWRHHPEGGEIQVELPQEVPVEHSQEVPVELPQEVPVEISQELQQDVEVERSQGVPVASIIEAFRQLSQRIDGRLDEEGLCVTAESEVGRAMVEVESFESGGFRSYFSLEFARPLLFELGITDRGAHHRWELWTHPDIEVGDERFDHDYVVRGEPAASVRSTLDANARAAIEALSRLTRGISVDRECASAVVVGLVLDPDQAEGIVHALEAVGRALTLLGSDPSAYR